MVKEAVREVASERDGLKAEVSSLTKKVSEVQSELQQVAKQKKDVDQQSAAAGKKDAQVCHMQPGCSTNFGLLRWEIGFVGMTLIWDLQFGHQL